MYPVLSGHSVDSMARVQRRATKMITECKGQNYESRLQTLGLISIEKRQTRGDLIQVFKLIKGVDNVDYREFFQLADYSRTRGHSFKITKVRSRLEIRRNFFSQRVVNKWNELPQYVVEAESVNAFKNSLMDTVRAYRVMGYIWELDMIVFHFSVCSIFQCVPFLSVFM